MIVDEGVVENTIVPVAVAEVALGMVPPVNVPVPPNEDVPVKTYEAFEGESYEA